MKSIKQIRLIAVVAFVVALPLIVLAAHWQSSDQWATDSINGYTVRQDAWGSGRGPQTIWVDSGTGWWNWGCWSQQPNTGGVKTYPHAAKSVNKSVNSLNSCTSSWSFTVANSGSFNAAYDIWASGSTYEIMIWLNKTGAVGPIGTYQTTVTISGASWNVYRGSNGSNQVFSFVRTSNVSSVSNLDIKSFLTYVTGRGWMPGSAVVGEVQAGFEITSSPSGQNFQTTSYSLTSN
jgi:hypothetical protein